MECVMAFLFWGVLVWLMVSADSRRGGSSTDQRDTREPDNWPDDGGG